jgi:transposase
VEFAPDHSSVSMLADHRDTDLESWLAQAELSGIRRDYAAVRATFTSEWSNGPVEAEAQLLKTARTTDVRSCQF